MLGIVVSCSAMFESLILLACLVASGCVSHATDGLATPGTSSPSAGSFSVYALSRGKGVPERTRQVFQEIRTLLEDAQQQGKIVWLKQTRIGLEGETRLCVECGSSAVAQELFEKIRELSKGVELLNVVMEPCPDR